MDCQTLALKGRGVQQGRVHECHEYLEEAWMQEPRRVRFLYQGILQVGVGFYHLQNGNWRGATGLLRNGTSVSKSSNPTLWDRRRQAGPRERAVSEELEDLGRERVREFDASKIPRVGSSSSATGYGHPGVMSALALCD